MNILYLNSKVMVSMTKMFESPFKVCYIQLLLISSRNFKHLTRRPERHKIKLLGVSCYVYLIVTNVNEFKGLENKGVPILVSYSIKKTFTFYR